MRSLWLVRSRPHETRQMKYFLENDKIAIGYPVGESLAHLSNEELRNRLRNAPQNQNWESGIGDVERLVRFMKPGDLVVVPDENIRDVFIAEITSDYIYVPELDKDQLEAGFPHQRFVNWLFDKHPVLRSELPDPLIKSLRYPKATADLTKHIRLVEEFIGYTDIELEETRPEINHLVDKAFQVLENALNSPDVKISLHAADILLRHSKQ